MPPRQAASEGMRVVWGSGCHVNCAYGSFPRRFLPGATDRYINSLVSQSPFPSRSLPSPHLAPSPLPYCCAAKPEGQRRTRSGFSVARSTGFDRFNWALTKCARVCDRSASWSASEDRACRVALLVLTGWFYTVVPTGFLPTKIKAISSVLFKHQKGLR